MSKPIYKPSKPYTEDINDLVEKGGVGSGKRGHHTNKEPSSPDASKLMNKLVLAQMNMNEVSPATWEKAAKALKTTVASLKSKVKKQAAKNESQHGPGSKDSRKPSVE